VLFGTAFILKHMLLASLNATDGGWLKRVAGALVSGVTLGALDGEQLAPATGYISFFTLGLFLGGLVLIGVSYQQPATSSSGDHLAQLSASSNLPAASTE
jgi:hypothetical protein